VHEPEAVEKEWRIHLARIELMTDDDRGLVFLKECK
jgi:hypothetical protein